MLVNIEQKNILLRVKKYLLAKTTTYLKRIVHFQALRYF